MNIVAGLSVHGWMIIVLVEALFFYIKGYHKCCILIFNCFFVDEVNG